MVSVALYRRNRLPAVAVAGSDWRCILLRRARRGHDYESSFSFPFPAPVPVPKLFKGKDEWQRQRGRLRVLLPSILHPEALISVNAVHLLISNPPHVEGWEAPRAAAALGMIAAEMRMKANYPVPEIWVARESAEEIEATRAALVESGIRCFNATVDDLAGIPASSAARAFDVTADGIVWRLDEGDFPGPPDARVLLVSVRPKQTVEFFRGGPGAIGRGHRAGALKGHAYRHGIFGAALVASESFRDQVNDAVDATSGSHLQNQGSAFIDAYFMRPGQLKRITIAQGTVSFAGLGPEMRGTAQENFQVLIQLVGQAHADAWLDERLVDIQARQTPVIGIAMPAILDAIAAGGPQPDPLELASRLVFLSAVRQSETVA